MRTDRVIWVDILKTLGIILVVLGHTSQIVTLNKIIYAFHMPLFFFASGYLFKPDKYNLISLISNRVKTLFIPFAIATIIITFMFNIFGGGSLTLKSIVSGIFLKNGASITFYGEALWFLPCLFTTSILFYLIQKFTNKLPSYLEIILFTAISYGALFLTRYDNFIPYSIDIAPIVMLFYLLGFL